MTPAIIARGSLGGQAIHSGQAAGFVFTETRHQPLMSLPRHANDRATLVTVLRGDYVETVGGRTRAHPPGTLIVRRPREVHSNTIGRKGAQCLLIELTADRFESLRDHTALFEETRAIAPGPAWGPALRAAREIASPDAATPLALEAHALEILAQAARGGARSAVRDAPSWLERVRGALEAQEGETWPGLSDLARMVGLHPVYVARAFRARYGSSIGDYARRRRLARACERLADSEMTLSEIAAWAGFHDQSHFSRVFRRATGWTPGGFRRAMRGGSTATGRVRRVLDPGDDARHP
jgi:AraC family transcriptional regulator